MSKFHEAIRQLLEDVQKFLVDTLNNEVLSATSLSHKESLLMKLHHLRVEYPQLQLTCVSEAPLVLTHAGASPHPSIHSLPSSNKMTRMSSGSPPPYIDMQGGSGTGRRVSCHSSTDYVLSDTSAEYEVYDEDSAITTSTESARVGTTVEDSHSAADGASEKTGIEAIPACDLMKAEKCGYLEKKGRERLGGLISPFQRRWCAVKDGIFYYYERPSDRRQKGQIDLSGYEVRFLSATVKDTSKKDLYFEIVCPGKRTYQFIAITPKDLRQWTAAIERNSQKNQPPWGKVSEGGLNEQPTHLADSTSQSNSGSSDGIIENRVCNNDKIISTSAHGKHSPDQDSIYETLDEENKSGEDAEIIYDEGESMLYNDDEELYMDAESLMGGSEEAKKEQEEFNPEDWYTGLWDCNSDNKNELSFVRGDLIKIISKEYDSYAWWVGELNGKIGLVPKTYLMEAYEMVQ